MRLTEYHQLMFNSALIVPSPKVFNSDWRDPAVESLNISPLVLHLSTANGSGSGDWTVWRNSQVHSGLLTRPVDNRLCQLRR